MHNPVLESLQHERDFKVLCDGLLRHECGPLVQSFAASGRDSGVDAMFEGTLDGLTGKWVFQYKFSSSETSIESRRRRIASSFTGRKSEFDKTGVQGADVYVLMTNVSMTVKWVEQMRKEWNSRHESSSFVVWDPSQINAMLKGREYLARSWSGALEAHSRDYVVWPIWRWVLHAYSVVLRWEDEPLWPLDVMPDDYKDHVGGFHQGFRWKSGLRVVSATDQLDRFRSLPQFPHASNVVYPSAMGPFDAVRGAVGRLSQSVVQHMKVVRTEVIERFPSILEIQDERHREGFLEALAFCVLECRWGYSMRGLHRLDGRQLCVRNRFPAYEHDSMHGAEPILDELVNSVPHGQIPLDVCAARDEVRQALLGWQHQLWYAAELGVDVDASSAR